MAFLTAVSKTWVSDPACQPIIAGNNLLGSALLTEAKWTDNGRQDATGSNNKSDNTDYPTTRAFDGHAHLPTQSSSALLTTHYFNCVVHDDDYIDLVAIFGHNFADIAGGVAVTIETADNDAFTSNLTTVHSFGTIITDTRLCALLSTRFGFLDRIRLKLVAAAAWRPILNEVFLSPATQITTLPIAPFDDRELLSSFDDATSENGATTRYVQRVGQAYFDYKFHLADQTETILFRAFHDDSDGYSRKMVLIPEYPTTQRAHLVLGPSDGRRVPLQGPSERLPMMPLVEVPTFLFDETQPADATSFVVDTRCIAPDGTDEFALGPGGYALFGSSCTAMTYLVAYLAAPTGTWSTTEIAENLTSIFEHLINNGAPNSHRFRFDRATNFGSFGLTTGATWTYELWTWDSTGAANIDRLKAYTKTVAGAVTAQTLAFTGTIPSTARSFGSQGRHVLFGELGSLGTLIRLDPASATLWAGKISCFGFWNRALTAAEIGQLFDTTTGKLKELTQVTSSRANLVAWWRNGNGLGDAATDQIFDQSGRGVNYRCYNMETVDVEVAAP